MQYGGVVPRLTTRRVAIYRVDRNGIHKFVSTSIRVMDTVVDARIVKTFTLGKNTHYGIFATW